MKRPHIALLLLAAAAVAASAATATSQGGAVVVPAVYENTDAPGLAHWPTAPFEARSQLLIDRVALGAAHNRPLVSIGVRRNAGDAESFTGARVELQLELAPSAWLARHATPSFAQNRGGPAVVAFSGVVDLPASPVPIASPAPWAAPHALTIPFAVPFRLAGPGLCIETVTRPYLDPATGRTEASWWPVDAFVRRAAGIVQTFGTSCVPGMGTTPASAVSSTWIPGGSGVLYVEGNRVGPTAICLLGLDDTVLGTTPLPLDLASFGAPGCALRVAPLASAPATIRELGIGPRGAARIELLLPNTPSIAGIDVYSQWFVQDQGSNSLGLTSTNGVRATVGAVPPINSFIWVESTDLSSPTGRVLRGRTPVLRIEHH